MVGRTGRVGAAESHDWPNVLFASGHEDRVVGLGHHLQMAGCGRSTSLLLTMSYLQQADESEAAADLLVERLRHGGWVTDNGSPRRTYLSRGFQARVAGHAVTAGRRSTTLCVWRGSQLAELIKGLAPLVEGAMCSLRSTQALRTVPALVANTRSIRLLPEQLVQRVAGQRILCYLGAGVSRSSGIRPLRGPDSLTSELRLDEAFPGRLLEAMVTDPSSIHDVLRRFHESFFTARPSPAHWAVAELIRQGLVSRVVTDNYDDLLHRVGVEPLSGAAFLVNPDSEMGEARVLLSVGVRSDEYGVIAACQSRGLDLINVDVAVTPLAEQCDAHVVLAADVALPILASAPFSQ